MGSEYKFQDVVGIPLSDAERDNQTINEEHAGAAVAAMHRDGIVVLENAVNVAHIDTLNQLLVAEADALASLPTTHFNDVRRFQPLCCREGKHTTNPLF